jgi:hypothetical protein
MYRKFRTYALLILSSGSLVGQTQGNYDFFPAGNFPGASYTISLGVSKQHIVGYYVVSGPGNAYVQTGTTFVDGVPPNSTSSYLTSINRKGLAAGVIAPLPGAAIRKLASMATRITSPRARRLQSIFP